MGIIRFLLALSVLIVHSSPIAGIEIVPGRIAVQSFYIISGFYITLIFTEKYSITSRPFFLFYSNRILRLYPLYALVIVMTVALSIIFGLWLGSYGKLQYYFDFYANNQASIYSLLAVAFSNISLIGQDWITFFNINESGNLYFLGLQTDLKLQELLLIPIAWTVSVELFFYAVSPFIVTKSKKIIILIIVLVLALRLAFYFMGISNGFTIYRFAPTELVWFLLGVLSYKLYHQKWLPDKRYGAWLMGVVILSLFMYKFLPIDWIVYSLLVICTPAIFYRISHHPVDRYIGELTYPLYISHLFFMMIVLANRFPKPVGPGIPLFFMTFMFSILIYHFFLKPVERLRASRISRSEKRNYTTSPKIVSS